MYVTRPLSLYRRDPSALSLPPPEGPNSGVLVIQDEEAQPTCCFGTCKSNQIKDMPFPQNMNLNAWYSSSTGKSSQTVNQPVVLIPVLDQPLSSNQYYVIQRSGKHKGKAHIKSKEEDKTTCCFCSVISDKKPEPFDLDERHQQFEICKKGRSGFGVRSSSADGYAPYFLRRGGLNVETSGKHEFLVNDAPGLDAKLRARLPDFNFPLSVTSSASVVVGKWYSPFIFIQEGTLKDQVKNSRYYEITLDQRWEKIFACENTNSSGNSVAVDVGVEAKAVAVYGKKVAFDKRNIVDGFMWFTSISNVGKEVSVGLSLAVVERMKLGERVGWTGETHTENQVKVKRVEEFEGNGEWKRFGCYVLVERFLIKRTDGSLVLSYEFKHTNQIKTKWE